MMYSFTRFIFTDNISMPPVVKPLTGINPATGQVIATIQQASKADVDAAVQSAVQGQREVWAAKTAVERARILRRASRYFTRT